MRFLHARTGRLGSGARGREPESLEGRDSACNVREPVPLRHLPQDRGGNQHVARLIRTEKEVEGQYTEQWVVVDEDALEQWPEGPLTTVGQKVPRIDGLQRARGEARYTADVQLPGMLHTAVLRSPYARARVTQIDLEPARTSPGVRAVLGPGELEVLVDEPGYVGQAVAAGAAGTMGQGEAAAAADPVGGDVPEPPLDPRPAGPREAVPKDGPNAHAARRH